jgi:hypothetical protein
MVKITSLISRAIYAVSFKIWEPPKMPPRFVNWLCRASMRANWYFVRRSQNKVLPE